MSERFVKLENSSYIEDTLTGKEYYCQSYKLVDLINQIWEQTQELQTSKDKLQQVINDLITDSNYVEYNIHMARIRELEHLCNIKTETIENLKKKLEEKEGLTNE